MTLTLALYVCLGLCICMSRAPVGQHADLPDKKQRKNWKSPWCLIEFWPLLEGQIQRFRVLEHTWYIWVIGFQMVYSLLILMPRTLKWKWFIFTECNWESIFLARWIYTGSLLGRGGGCSLNNNTIGSGFPPISCQIPPTSGCSDWLNCVPHKGYRHPQVQTNTNPILSDFSLLSTLTLTKTPASLQAGQACCHGNRLVGPTWSEQEKGGGGR